MLRIALSTIVFFAFLILPTSAYGQSCGDANGSGGLSISDVVYMFDYIYKAGPPPADFDLADFDFHQEWTINDAARIFSCTFSWCEPNLYCPPTDPAWDPSVTVGYRIRHTAAFPAHLEHSIVDLALDAPELAGLQLPLRILVDSTPAQIDSVHFPVSGSWFTDVHNLLVVPPTPGVFVMNSLPIFFSSPGPSTPLARVFISAPADTASRLINLEFADYVPAQAPPGHDGPITPMIATWSVPVQPSFFGTCCLVPGDANGDGQLSISDAVYLVSFYFAGGPPPMGCTALGDADGNGSLSVSDAVRIIGHIFSGGLAPVCI